MLIEKLDRHGGGACVGQEGVGSAWGRGGGHCVGWFIASGIEIVDRYFIVIVNSLILTSDITFSGCISQAFDPLS